jgi:hypothetical protein
MEKVLEAIEFAAKAHDGQYRKSGAGPYISHPFSVMYILAQSGVKNSDILIASVLHDTVEDTDVTIDLIDEIFGSKVASYVKEVTDDKTLPKAERKRLQIEHAKTMCRESIIIKMADKYHNLQSFTKSIPEGWSSKRVKGYFAWAYYVVKEMFIRTENMTYNCDNHIVRTLYDKLTNLFDNSTFHMDGEYYSCLPKHGRADMLEQYLLEMERTTD